MSSINRRSTRRTFVSAVGSLFTLPGLARARASNIARNQSFPKRFVVVYTPNGVNKATWSVGSTPDDPIGLGPTLQPLRSLQKKILLISGLSLQAAIRRNVPGDHARAMASFLSGVTVPQSTVLQCGVSADQIIAARVGRDTVLRSLEIGLDDPKHGASCDNGHACAYTSNLSWAAPDQPLPRETNPALLFDRVFGFDSATIARRKSVLDANLRHLTAIRRQISSEDALRLDRYATNVRDLERSLSARHRAYVALRQPKRGERPAAAQLGFVETTKAVFDVVAAALERDATRVVTISLGSEGNAGNRPYPWLGIRNGHHDVSHHRNDAGKLKILSQIDLHHVELLATFLSRLDSVAEGDGTMLDNTVVLYGSGIADGDKHSHNNIPILLAGGSRLGIRGGRRMDVESERSSSDLLLALIQAMGVQAKRHGDSECPLELS